MGYSYRDTEESIKEAWSSPFVPGQAHLQKTEVVGLNFNKRGPFSIDREGQGKDMKS